MGCCSFKDTNFGEINQELAIVTVKNNTVQSSTNDISISACDANQTAGMKAVVSSVSQPIFVPQQRPSPAPSPPHSNLPLFKPSPPKPFFIPGPPQAYPPKFGLTAHPTRVEVPTHPPHGYNPPPIPPPAVFHPHPWSPQSIGLSRYPPPQPPHPPTVPKTSPTQPVRPIPVSNASQDATYSRSMSGLRFDMCVLSTDYNANVNIKRVTCETKALSTDLPCEAAAAIFVRGDSRSMSHFQALLSGVEGTPYAHGLYLFDISLPETYPAAPPKVALLTTGNTSVRFNPNLYNTGYVCLSIINTWRSDQSEAWNPSLSSIFQVLISIQSLVMTGNVISKEPGLESQVETGAENRVYSAVVRYANMRYAIAGMVNSPPKGFEEVVRKHFALKKEKLLADVHQWVSESQSVQGLLATSRLAGGQNPATVQAFSTKGAAQCFMEAQQEVIAALKLV